MYAGITIAEFKARATENTEEITVIVREYPHSESFEVFVDGGLLSDGRETFSTFGLKEALTRAAEEVRVALNGGR